MVAEPVQEGLHRPVGAWPEDVESPARLFRQGRQKTKLEPLPGRAGLGARPRPDHGAELIAENGLTTGRGAPSSLATTTCRTVIPSTRRTLGTRPLSFGSACSGSLPLERSSPWPAPPIADLVPHTHPSCP